MVFLKFITPGNLYSSRSLRVISSDGAINYLKPDGNLSLENTKQCEYQLKLDYHKLLINREIEDQNRNYYFIIFFNFRQFLPLFLFDLMFKNCLRIKEVSEKDFYNLTKLNFNLSSSKLTNKKDPIVKKILFLSLLNGILQLSIFFRIEKNIPLYPVLFFCTLIGLVSIVYFAFISLKLTTDQFLLRIASYSVFSTVLILELEIGSIQTTIILITFLMLILYHILVFYNRTNQAEFKKK